MFRCRHKVTHNVLRIPVRPLSRSGICEDKCTNFNRSAGTYREQSGWWVCAVSSSQFGTLLSVEVYCDKCFVFEQFFSTLSDSNGVPFLFELHMFTSFKNLPNSLITSNFNIVVATIYIFLSDRSVMSLQDR